MKSSPLPTGESCRRKYNRERSSYSLLIDYCDLSFRKQTIKIIRSCRQKKDQKNSFSEYASMCLSGLIFTNLDREKEVSQEEPTNLEPSGLSALFNNQKGKGAIPAQQTGLPIRVYLPNK
jgi:hypothetical protein